MTRRTRTGRAELRHRAEERLREDGARDGASPRPDEDRADTERILHELRVHQLELEMQNEELRASRLDAERLLQRYAELFDFAPVGFFRLDPQGKVVEANFAAARLLGRERGRLAGQPFHAFVATREQGAFQAFLAAVMAPGPEGAVSLTHELPLLGPAGGERWARLTGVILPEAADGRPTALLAVEDVTGRRHAEEALQAEARHKDEFLAALSHELRNPLAPIRMALALLRRIPWDSEKGAATLSVIDRQTAHLTRIVEDLLDVTRIARGKVRLDREPLEFSELVRGAVEDHRAAYDAARVGLRFERGRSSLWVDADGARLVQVLGNLLGNALKFTPPGGGVAVLVDEEHGRATLRVRDNGVGIAPEVIGHLFIPFSQGPQGLDRSRGGLGLGLATARGLIELHGGTVDVRSEGPGRGSEFIVRLPLSAPARRPAPAPTHPAVRPLRILVIEDNDDAGATLKDVLELVGHEVRVALDGPSGLSLAHDFLPELVLCDLGLPRMSGYEVARALRADPLLRGVRLVALSGYAQQEDAQRADESGFDRHVPKPASQEVLDQILSETAQHPHSTHA